MQDKEITASALEQAVAMSERMWQRAQDGDWPQVAELERQRDPLLKHYFGSGPLGDTDLVVAALHQILALDARLIELADNEQRICVQSLSELNTAQRAVRAYDANR